MPKKSPNVILKCKYELALNRVDKKIKDDNFINKRKKDVNNMIDYYSNPKEKAMSMFDYFAKENKNNLILEDGRTATKKDMLKLKKCYEKYIENSNLWKGIISFNNDYIYENISLKTLEQKFAKEIMPQFLKYCGFKNRKDMSYVFAIHTKSKSGHIHIHFAFIEKKPNYIYSKNITGYRSKGKITEAERNYLKRLVSLSIEREKYYTPLLTKTNEDIDELKKYFNPNEKNFLLNNIEEIKIEEKILKLGSLLKEYRNINNSVSKKVKYNSIKNNSLGREIKNLTQDIKKYLFLNKESSLFQCQDKIDKDLEKLNNYFKYINSNLNIKEKILENKLVENKKEYLNNYVYNSIINNALYKYEHVSSIVKSKINKDEITIEDLIQEIVFQKFKNDTLNDRDRKIIVLTNYLKGNTQIIKFPSKYKVEKALRNINYEMEKASQEFTKLFEYDSKTK